MKLFRLLSIIIKHFFYNVYWYCRYW